MARPADRAAPCCSYEQYAAAGGALPETEFAPRARRASAIIDRLTHGRAAPALAAHTEQLQAPLADACIGIIRLLDAADAGRAAAAGGLASASNDGYSESYLAPAAARNGMDAACLAVLADALGADPYGLLYAGID